MSKPKISVYIPSHNYGEFLQESIESVLRQTYDSWELLVINDKSSDNTSDIMELYSGDERIRLFHTNYGSLPKVCNFAIRKSRGEYIIRLDGDDVFGSNILLVLATHMERNPDCSMVFPDYYLIDESGNIFAEERREKYFERNHVFDSPANGACCLIRKCVLEQIGCYREDLGAQDGYDLWNKLINSLAFANINLPLFYYRRHSTNLTCNTHRILIARRRIKLDAIADKLERFKPIILFIPCRRNYDFALDLWKRELGSKSLLEREIEKVLPSKIFDHIVVGSDSLEAKNVVEKYSDPRLHFHLRKREDTIRSTSLAVTLKSLFLSIDSQLSGITVVSYPQAPFVTLESLEEAATTLVINDADSALGVEEIKAPLYKRDSHGLTRINPNRGFNSDFDTLYQEVNTARALKNKNVTRGSMEGSFIVYFTMQNDESFFINSEQKMRIAQVLLKESEFSTSLNKKTSPQRGKYGVIIAARTGSTRLPGKALLPLGNIPMIVYLIRRLKPSKFADAIIFATTDLPEDDTLAEIVKNEGIPVFRGSNNNVVERYVNAAKHFEFDYVVRVTGDCPFVDSNTLDFCIKYCKKLDKFDIASTKKVFPVGIDFEIYRAEIMAELHDSNILTDLEREHLTLHFYNNPGIYTIHKIQPKDQWFCSDKIFTVDTVDDYNFACSIVRTIPSVDTAVNTIINAAHGHGIQP